MPLRVLVQYVKDGRYNVIVQAGYFASAAKRIVRNQTLDKVEEFLFALDSCSEIEINGTKYPYNPASVPVIMSDINVSNLNFGS